MGVQLAIAGRFIGSTGPFQNKESKAILITHCYKINIQNQEQSKNQYQESLSIFSGLNVKINIKNENPL